MRWVDVMGPTGVGKTTLCTPDCNPDDFPNTIVEVPEGWRRFVACAKRTCDLADENGHPGTWRMTQNAIWRMAAVARRPGDAVYMNVGLAHRGLSIAWRLPDPKEIGEFFAAMPVSIGVASLSCDLETLRRRNVERGKAVPNKQRAALASRMERVRPIVVDAVRAAGIPLIEIDTMQPVALNVGRLREFAGLPALAA